jgi:hypothetical protein
VGKRSATYGVFLQIASTFMVVSDRNEEAKAKIENAWHRNILQKRCLFGVGGLHACEETRRIECRFVVL